MPEEKISITHSTIVYSVEAIRSLCYKYSDEYYFHIMVDDTAKTVSVEVTSKDGIMPKTFIQQFENELIDQQLRVDLNNRFQSIREALVKEAFEPISKQ